jgi:Domain of unknown function (DUF3560)
MVTIDTSGSGAIAEGTTRDHAPVMKANRWRWSRNLSAWYLPRTFRPETVDRYVTDTVTALKAAGVDVELIDGERDNTATRAARRQERDRELVELNEQRAATAATEADQAWQQAQRIAGMIPPGQPILVGHHSERRHRRDLAKIDRAMRRSIDADDTARHYQHRAAAAASRVEIAQTERTVIDPATIRPGDYVRAETPRERRSHGWHRVIRVNKTTVTVPALIGGDDVTWTDRIPLDHLVELRPADPQRTSRPPRDQAEGEDTSCT